MLNVALVTAVFKTVTDLMHSIPLFMPGEVLFFTLNKIIGAFMVVAFLSDSNRASGGCYFCKRKLERRDRSVRNSFL